MKRALKAKIIGKYGTQADFAQQIRVDESIVSRVIRGRRTLQAQDQRKWAKALDCKPEDLFTP